MILHWKITINSASLLHVLMKSIYCCFFSLYIPRLSKAHSSCPCSDPSISPPGKEMYNQWNVPPVRVLEWVVCVQIDGQTQIPRVTLQSSQSNKCCSLNNSGLDLHHGLACWENTTHGYDFRVGGHDPWWRDDWKKREMMDNEKEPLFRSWACSRRWLRDASPGGVFPGKMTRSYFCNCTLSSHTRTVVSKKSRHFQTVGMINY